MSTPEEKSFWKWALQKRVLLRWALIFAFGFLLQVVAVEMRLYG